MSCRSSGLLAIMAPSDIGLPRRLGSEVKTLPSSSQRAHDLLVGSSHHRLRANSVQCVSPQIVGSMVQRGPRDDLDLVRTLVTLGVAMNMVCGGYTMRIRHKCLAVLVLLAPALPLVS